MSGGQGASVSPCKPATPKSKTATTVTITSTSCPVSESTGVVDGSINAQAPVPVPQCTSPAAGYGTFEELENDAPAAEPSKQQQTTPIGIEESRRTFSEPPLLSIFTGNTIISRGSGPSVSFTPPTGPNGSGGGFWQAPPRGDPPWKKWYMVFLLSFLSGINQAICYSYAPVANIVEKRWENTIHSTELITIYFVSYIPFSFFGSWVIDRKGLRYGVLMGASLQAIGASIRYLAGYAKSTEIECFGVYLGQTIASTAMPFMVNSPPVLSANWFPWFLRATSTSIAVNANAMGIAFVYLTCHFVVNDVKDVPTWNLWIAVVAVVILILSWLSFESFPAKPGSMTRLERASITSDVQLRDEYDWSQWHRAFSHKGFWMTVVAFSVAECVVNAMSALLGKFLACEHFTKSQIGVIGAVFIVSSLVGGQIFSAYVDRKRCHQSALQFCLLLTAVSMLFFKSTLAKSQVIDTLLSLMLVGAFLGPIQPIVLELGVECAFPTSESTVAALQQLCGNFLSAIVVPGMSVLRRSFVDSSGHIPMNRIYASPEVSMTCMLMITAILFWFFNGEYKRMASEMMRKTLQARRSDEFML